MKTGIKICVNNGQIEKLIEIDHPYGLFKADIYQVVRNLSHIREAEIVTDAQ